LAPPQLGFSFPVRLNGRQEKQALRRNRITPDSRVPAMWVAIYESHCDFACPDVVVFSALCDEKCFALSPSRFMMIYIKF
jgi:hypothetical protein